MKYLISETTREERKQLVNKALAVSLTGAKPPSQEVLDLVEEYINGYKELEDIQQLIINQYQHKGDE